MLDLFAGTGAVGIEALSRGAAHATFLERGGGPTGVLRRNLKELGLCERARVLRMDARRGLARLRREGLRFDWVFADPPYADGWSHWLAHDPAVVDVLVPSGILILERAHAAEKTPEGGEGLRLIGSRAYGSSCFDWYEETGE